ncbi:MAG: hypothetical protein LBN95_04625 [Prevotellaceae bacterium]|jgi:uncharacterized Zn finger protein|nr:hypothetical protein [Prevotellaceae bacterium]
MKIPLNEFEQHIDETILKRGLSYFKKGQIGEIEEVGAGEYQAVVQGTDDYLVQMTVKNEIITEYVCDCPYDVGPVCKHVAAVIFALQSEELGMKDGSFPKLPKAKKAEKTSKKKTPAEEAKELLEKVSHEELKAFVLKKISRDNFLRNDFIFQFMTYNTDNSREYYENQLKALVKSAKGRDGFIDWDKARTFNRNVSEYLQLAEKSVTENNFAKAMNIAMATAVQAMDAFNCGDDSNGEFGGLISGAFEILWKITEEKLSENEKNELLNFCYNSFDKKTFDGFDWHTELLQMALSLIKTENETKEIFTRLDAYEKNDDKYGWRKQEAQNIKYEILSKFDKEKAEKFLLENLENDKFRTAVIEKAIAKKNYEKAKKIAIDGIEFDKKDKPGLVNRWTDYILKIAIIQQDTENIIEYAKRLYFEKNTEKKGYYKILKDNIKPENWTNFVDKTLIAEWEKRGGWNYHNIAEIFIAEQQWQRLLNLLKEHSSLGNIALLEPYLKTNYADELITLYAKEIVDYAAKFTGRSYYAEICKYLRRIIKLGGRTTADLIIKNLRETYKNRPALLQELNLV